MSQLLWSQPFTKKRLQWETNLRMLPFIEMKPERGSCEGSLCWGRSFLGSKMFCNIPTKIQETLFLACQLCRMDLLQVDLVFFFISGGVAQRLGSQWVNNLFNFYEGNPINLHDPLLPCLGRNFYIVNNWSLVGAWHLETFMADGIPFL